MEVKPEEHISKDEVVSLLTQQVGLLNIQNIEPIIQGSTNIIFKITVGNKNFILKISHRTDRNTGNILFKEAQMLKKLWDEKYSIPIPKLIWQGKTSKDWPALLETCLKGQSINKILKVDTNIEQAAFELGKFVAELHQKTQNEINEFETNRPTFLNFKSYAQHWLDEWLSLLRQATHVKQNQINTAYNFIRLNLDIFTEKNWSFVHADISKQNLLGIVKNETLELTGLCDFENVQTAPPEYDIATIDDDIFLDYPSWEKPFMSGYKTVAKLNQGFEQRLKVINLFRSLRYIKRSVKYNETHYFEHDRRYFEKWLKKI